MDEKTHYKFMTSVLMPAWYRGLYIKGLDKIAPNAYVPFFRIMISLAIGSFAVVFGLWLLMSNAARAPYILAPVILVVVATLLATLIFMLSSHSGSMLTSTAKLNLAILDEKKREKTSLAIKSLGVHKISDKGAQIEFDNGDLGQAYVVKGSLSISTLPQTAQFIARIRRGYFIGRTKTSQELNIITIEPNSLKSQKKSLDKIAREHEGKSDQEKWIYEMAKLQSSYIDELVEQGHQLTLTHTVIIRDNSYENLQRSCSKFERAAAQGMFEQLHPVTSKRELISRLAGVSMLEGGRANAH